MPTHYVYDEVDKESLSQGDVLQRTDALTAHLRQFHSYYADHADYKRFMVVTQTCDLVRRENRPPTSPYITIAAVRPVEEVLRREAAKTQMDWQRETKCIGTKTKDKLIMFLESLIDNNKDGYFYLHQDVTVGIQENCCAFLQLSVALKSEHYDLCLAAKIAQLKEPFQAKLGYLLGHMYSRVGTSEWNAHYTDNKVATVAAALLKKTFVTFADAQIAEGLADLEQDGSIKEKTSKEIREYINRKKVVSRKKKFQGRAQEVLSSESSPIDMVRNCVTPAIQQDVELTSAIEEILAAANVPEDQRGQVKDKLLAAFMSRMRHHLSDENMPKKDDVFRRILMVLLQDSLIEKIMT